MLIVFGILTEHSIGQLFLAGIIPGLIIALFFIGIIYGWVKINPKIAPMSERSTWKARVKSLPEVVWIILVFLLVIGGIMQGFFTPTEAGAVGTFAILLLAVAKRTLNFSGYVKSLSEALRTAGMIMELGAGSRGVWEFKAGTKISKKKGEGRGGEPLERYVVLCLWWFIYRLGGAFLCESWH